MHVSCTSYLEYFHSADDCGHLASLDCVSPVVSLRAQQKLERGEVLAMAGGGGEGLGRSHANQSLPFMSDGDDI